MNADAAAWRSFYINKRRSALLGAVVWLVQAGLSATGYYPAKAIELLFLLGPLMVVPLGLAVIETLSFPTETGLFIRVARFLQPVGATVAAASFVLPAQIMAGGLALPWLAVTVCTGLSGVRRLLQGRFGPIEEACFTASLLYLPVGGLWLVMSRAGGGFLGFKEPIVLLTAVHFHFSGFAAPIIAGATGSLIGRTPSVRRLIYSVACLGVIASPALLAAGFVLLPALKLVSAFILAFSLTVIAVLTLILATKVSQKLARMLLMLSAGSAIAGMALAATYSAGEFTSHEIISIPTMALSHGAINGFGFGLCGMIAWTECSRIDKTLPRGLGEQNEA